MSGLSVWIGTILAVAIIGVVADLVLSGNRMHKFVRGIFGIITIFVIAAPLPSIIKGGFKWDFDWGGSTTIDQNWLDQVQQRQLQLMQDGVQQLLHRNGIQGARVTIDGKVDNLQIHINTVTVDLTQATIDQGNSHKDINEIVVSTVSQALNIDQSLILILK
jgi:preprotein translocase subunit SecF